MDYVLKLLKNEKQSLENKRRMFKLALFKNGIERRDILHSETIEIERAMDILSKHK